MIHPVTTPIVQRPRQELSTLVQPPQATLVQSGQAREQDDEEGINRGEANNQSVMPLVAEQSNNSAPVAEDLAVSVLNTTKLEPHLESKRENIISGLRNLAMLWTAFCGNLVLLLYYNIPMYPFLSLVALSEYTTALKIRYAYVKR